MGRSGRSDNSIWRAHGRPEAWAQEHTLGETLFPTALGLGMTKKGTTFA